MLCLLMAKPADAHVPSGSTCHAYSDAVMTIEAAVQELAWNCEDTGWEDGRGVTWLRFDNWDKEEPPLVFVSRPTVFETAAIFVLGNDGSIRGDTFDSGDVTLLKAGPLFSLPLPELTEQSRSVVVMIESPHSVTVASEAQLALDPENAEGALTPALLLAMVAGMLVMPLLFDCLFYMVLRERFVLLHAAMAISMLTYVLTAGGVITAFIALPNDLIARTASLSWVSGSAFGGLFLASFLEPHALPRRVRKALVLCALWTFLVPGFAGLQFDFSQSFDNRLFFYAFLPVVPLYSGAIILALFRGSRSARFLALAWLPLITASIDRMLRGMGLYTAPDSIDRALFVALALEVIIVALAVADRFIAIRRERDLARTAARNFAQLTERDPLTGLLNRRALEDRFETLRAEGYCTLAIIDLDHFKTINDCYGHVVGDTVLRTVAEALETRDDDTQAYRVGGEEFILMLRGRNTVARAEKLRDTIRKKTADHAGMDGPVTASMGIVDAPHDVLPHADFHMLYNRADQLLYEAKAAGRNRTMSEKLKVFRPRGRDKKVAA